GTLELEDPQELLGSIFLATKDLVIVELLTGTFLLAALIFLEYTNVTTCLSVLLTIGMGSLGGTIVVVAILVKGHKFPTSVNVRPVALATKVTHVEESTGVLESTFAKGGVVPVVFPDLVICSVSLICLVLFFGGTATSLVPKSVRQGQVMRTMMTCHIPIRPAATCTVPRTQIISRQPPATWQLPIGQPLRITVVIGDWRSTVAANDGRRWRTTVDCRWTTIDHHRTTGQWWLVNSQRWTWAGSGPVPPHVSHVCTRVSHVCQRGIHLDADVDNMTYVGVEPGALWLKT
nr:hypothetical protein [Tanacetum cinerariifolium]